MCGIGSITISNQCTRELDLTAGVEALLLELESRGGHASGVMALDSQLKLHVQKAAVSAAAFIRDMSPLPSDTLAVAVHTRFATKGAKEWPKNNHPVQCGDAWLLHNGVVDDHDTARDQGDPWVDTFALSAALSDLGAKQKGQSPRQYAKAVGNALATVDGSAAIVGCIDGEAMMITARLHGSPLYFAESGGVRIAASTIKAVQDAADAMDLELPVKRVSIKVTQGKGQTIEREELREDITQAEEGRVLSWQEGRHNRLMVLLPERTYRKPWKAKAQTGNATTHRQSGYNNYDYDYATGGGYNSYSYESIRDKTWVAGKGWVATEKKPDSPALNPSAQQQTGPQYPESFRTIKAGSSEYEEMRRIFRFWRLSAHGLKWAQKHPNQAASYDAACERMSKHGLNYPFPTAKEALAMTEDPLYTREAEEAKKIANPPKPTSSNGAAFVGDSSGVVSVTSELSGDLYDMSLSRIVERMLSDRGTDHLGWDEVNPSQWRRCDLCSFECDDVTDYLDGALCGDCALLWRVS